MNKKKTRVRRVLLPAVLGALVSFAAVEPAVFAETASAAQGTIPAVVQQTTASVVAIIGKPGEDRKVWEASRYDLAHGTGVIVKSDGYILTNAHVVKNMRNITVVTAEGKSYAGTVTHYDEASDLALVKIEAQGLKAAVFAAPDKIRVGEQVMAIGTPLSFALRNSVTYGIVSGMERTVQSQYQLIQTDAAINPGNSGGALVNMNGEVIGINTMKYVEYGVDSLGFAIPVDTVQYVLDHFFKYGKVKRPYLGLELGESWEAVVGLPAGSGLEVTYVEPESPAAAAGVKQGDILLAVGSAKTSTLVEYNEAMKLYLPQDKVKLKIQSAGKTNDIEVQLGEDKSGGTDYAAVADLDDIDDDRGKVRIGDSHFGWTMKYPVGMAKVEQAPDGSSVTFVDAKGEYMVMVMIVEDQSENMSPLALLKMLSGFGYSETVLEKSYVDRQPHSYAQLVAKSEDGSHYQVRLMQNGDKIYYVGILTDNEEMYLNNAKRSSYEELLDSFVLTYDSEDAATKDISVHQSGNEITTEYGLLFELPTDWSGSEWGGSLSYSDEEGDLMLNVKMTSAASGDTAKAWAQREEKEWTARYAKGYIDFRGAAELELGGEPAVDNRYSYTMGDKWMTEHVFYIVRDKYKYELTLAYEKDKEGEATEEIVDMLKQSVQFSKEWMNASLGFIQDEDELYDASRTTTYKSEEYGYSIQVPEQWGSGYDDFGYGYMSGYDSPIKAFMFEGGSLNVQADDRSELSEVLKKLEQEHKKKKEIDANYKYSVTEETKFGTKTYKISTQYKTQNVPYNLNEYVLEHDGVIYTITAEINDAVKTEARWKQLQTAVDSLKFID